MIILTNTKAIFIVAVLELILLVACIILLVIKPSNEINSHLPAYFVADPTRTLNNGKFYYNGDTDSIYYEVKNGYIQLVFTEENFKEYCRKSGPNRSEDSIDKTYNWNVEFWEEPRPYNVWVCYFQPPEPDMVFLSFEVIEIEMYDRIVPAPGVGWTYIDENNFGSFGDSNGDTIFTRVSE